ncbi:MAG: DUF3618 domain-containing protein [Chthoniobacterales bacterium]
MDSKQSELEKERLDEASSEEIRADIRGKRREMDEKIDQLGDRLHPRHLLDDVIDIFRRRSGSGGGGAGGADIGQSTRQAGRAVKNQLKENPVPALLVGAGVAWWLLGPDSDDDDAYGSDYRYPERDRYRGATVPTGGVYATEGVHAGEVMVSGPGATSTEGGSDGPGIGERAKDKLAETGERTRERLSAAGAKIAGAGGSVRDSVAGRWDDAGRGVRRGHQGASRQAAVAKERFLEASDEHPLSMGGVFLAVGVMAGLLLPRSRAEDEWMGDASDHLIDDVKERGKTAASQTAGAALDEAEAHGLTPGNLTEKAGRVISQAVEAGKEAARDEGISGKDLKEKSAAVKDAALGEAKTEGEKQKRDADDANPLT